MIRATQCLTYDMNVVGVQHGSGQYSAVTVGGEVIEVVTTAPTTQTPSIMASAEWRHGGCRRVNSCRRCCAEERCGARGPRLGDLGSVVGSWSSKELQYHTPRTARARRQPKTTAGPPCAHREARRSSAAN
jgi:hypothetical protein